MNNKEKLASRNGKRFTSSIKREIFEIGGVTMSDEMRAILDSERAIGKKEGIAEGKREGMLEGKKVGRAEEKLSLLISLVKDKLLSVAEAAKRLGVSEKDFIKMTRA